MRSTTLRTLATVVSVGSLLGPALAHAAPIDVYLQARAFTKTLTLPDSTTVAVPMWGFAACNSDFSVCATDAPGPRIDALPGDSLTIHVQNMLPTTPVSIVIPGQLESGAGSPTTFTDARARSRVQSFTDETPPLSTNSYTWSALRAGTYLYQSGTYPSIQVPMGLYGALVVADAPPGGAYPGITRDADQVLLFSEIDPLQNAAVAAAGGNVASYPSTIDYNPIYFLTNGALSTELQATDGTANSNVLLRLINAGLRSHTPSIVGLDLALVAEDGNAYPGLPRVQASALLPAGKTLDALVALPAGDLAFALYDRMPAFTNDDVPNNGLVGSVIVGDPLPPPPATSLAADDTYAVTEDLVFSAPFSVLANDTGLSGATLVSGPANGTLTCGAAAGLCSDGTFTYAPNSNFSGADGFTYNASDGTNSYAARAVLDVSFVNDDPVAADDDYVSTIGGTIAVPAPGVLGNDADADGDTLAAALVAPVAGLTLNSDGSFTYSGPTAEFSYEATDGSVTSVASVQLTVSPASGIALNVQEPSGAPITNYRWLLQEDATYPIDPLNPPALSATLSTNFHKSHMPVVAQGCVGCTPEDTQIPFEQAALDPAKRYYVSVLPNDAGTGTGHTLGGAQIPVGSTGPITVIVNNQEIPTAQISVLVFEDTFPTNGAPDPGEAPLGGFQITLEDAGGRYGISGGTMSQDAFGQPLRNSLLGTPGCPGAAAEGVILTCPNGTALIQDLAPGKYGVIAVPPGDQVSSWTQTSTIEGTKVIDTWVKAGEPPFFAEFGTANFHAFIGFVNPSATTVPGGGSGSNTITGSVTLSHAERAPSAAAFDSGSYDAFAHTRAWIGVNSNAGAGPNIATVQAEPDGSFSISGIPDGTHQLAIWDTYLDQIIFFRTVILPGGSDVGNIPVNAWFGRQEHNVFLDANADGVRQEDEPGLPEQNVNLRFRDGTIFQAFPTDTEGFVPFDQVFPFGSWQVAEVDYTRFLPTGITVTVDGGGDVSGGPYPGLLNPQAGTPRTETGPVLLEGFQSTAGMTSVFDWGKKPYSPGENGGISGVVFYGSTRGEADPRLTVGDPWEPGVPSVKVRLYREVATAEGGTALALLEEVETDSWDANPPTECEGETADNPFVTQTLAGNRTQCYDGVRNWDQVRPAVFDGGYAFGASEEDRLPPGKYVVEVVPPPGYELIKEEDVNVGFGDAFGSGGPFAIDPVVLPNGMLVTIVPDPAMIAALGAEPGLAQPPCVGPYHRVPPQLSLFPGEDAPFADADRPLCNRKAVVLADQSQAAADFHLFTSTPVAGEFQGLATDDIAIESDPASASFGDKWGPAFMPISMRDFKGREIYRTYTDAFGRYNGMVPSTFSANLPVPSGYSPAMQQVCLNDPLRADGTVDPLRNPNYGTFCYTLQYMPGTTTYLDTPLIPQAAFAAGFNSVDCGCTDGTPKIRFVGVQGGGGGFGPLVAPGQTLVIRSAGQNVAVPNPAYEGPTAAAPYNQPTITRDFDFGTQQGTVTIGGVPLTITGWNRNQIQATAPGAPMTGELVVTRGDNGKRSINTVTVTVGTETPIRVSAGQSIQAAIDGAAPGALILVDEGIFNELLVMWKPVRLQGSGAATVVNGLRQPPEALEAWRQKVTGLIDSGAVDLLPGQPAGDFDLVAGGLFGTELGAAITVLAPANGSFGASAARIDGFTITGADGGGGVFVNGYAHNLEIANNHVTGNMGNLSGGIRVGHAALDPPGNGPYAYNSNVRIHDNAITLNGARAGNAIGGGVALAVGTDGYDVANNFICGNFSLSNGAGIGHFGLSDNGRIRSNQILFNQSYHQEVNRSGGGILIAGEPRAGGLTRGAGDVTINGNLIQGNQAASGHGAGIRMQNVNGVDATTTPWSVTITNNMVVNNVAGWSGAGVSLQDTVSASIVNNTIAHNDTTATVGGLVAANASTPQPAGISAERHSLALAAALATANGFSNPSLVNNIIWENRAFTYDVTAGGARLLPQLAPPSVGACAAGASYWDLGVLGEPLVGPTLQLNPTYSVLTSTAGYAASNVAGNPGFLAAYCNGARTLSTPGSMQVAAEVIEGGNFIDVRYGPLTQTWPAASPPWNYHIGAVSAGLNNGGPGFPPTDFDGESRPQGSGVERGADELYVPGNVTFLSATNATLTGNTLNFGNIPGNGTRDSVVTLRVTGNPVTFQSLIVTNSAGSGFSKLADACTGLTVANMATCTVTIRFSYAGNNMKQGVLTVTDNGAGSPQLLSLRGQ